MESKMNLMKKIVVDKLTLNVGAGKDQQLLEKAMKLLKNITNVNPVKTITNKRIQSWGLRPGLAVGCKITLRGKKANELLAQLLKAKDNTVKESCFDDNGNFSFGIHEYIDIPDVKYDPDIGIIGLQISVTLKRPGYRVKERSVKKGKLGKNHLIKKEDAITFFKENYNINLGE